MTKKIKIMLYCLIPAIVISSTGIIVPIVVTSSKSNTSNSESSIDNDNYFDVLIDKEKTISVNGELVIEPTINNLNKFSLEYQWYLNGKKISNQTNQTLKISNISYDEFNNKDIYLEIKDNYKTVKSNNCKINVVKQNADFPTQVSIQKDIVVNENSNIEIDPVFTPQIIPNENLKFKWFVDNKEKSTSKKLIINNASYQEYNTKQVYLEVSSLDNTKTIKSNTSTIHIQKNDQSNDMGKLNVDYFVLPGKDHNDIKNRITLFDTSNEDILTKYGDVPLPWKPDNEITIDDLTNMFLYGTMQSQSNRSFSYNFGQRNISSDLVAMAMLEFNRKYFKYFPNISLSNYANFTLKTKGEHDLNNYTDKANFNKKELIDQEWYVKSASDSKHANSIFRDWILNTEERDFFNKFIYAFLTRLRPGMSDIDKFFVCLDTTEQWLEYTGHIPSDMGVKKEMYINNKNTFYGRPGSCSTFSGLFSWLANISGLPSSPIFTNYTASGMNRHLNSIVYLDVSGKDNEENRKWYQVDPTFFSVPNALSNTNGATLKNANDKRMLMNLRRKEAYWNPNENTDGYQYHYNRLNGLVWHDLYKKVTDVKISSEEEDGLNVNKVYSSNSIWNLFNNGHTVKSKFIFINGKWYIFVTNISVNNGSSKFYEIDYQNGLLSGPKCTEVPNYLGKYKDQILNFYKDKRVAFASQVNDKTIFMIKDKLLVVPTYEQETNGNIFDWDKAIEINLPDEIKNKDIKDYAYDAIENQFVFYLSDNEKEMYRMAMPEEHKSLFDLTKKENKSEYDIDLLSQYYFLIGGNITSGDNFGQISLDEKIDFYKDIEKIKNENKTTKTSKEELFNRLNSNYQKILNSSLSKQVNHILPSKALEEKAFISKQSFESHGYEFKLFNYTNINDIIYGNNRWKSVYYNIYFKPKNSAKSDFTLVKEKSYDSRIEAKDLKKYNFDDPNGYYYIQMYPATINAKTEKVLYNSPVIELISNDEDNNISTVDLNILGTQRINYSFEKNKWIFDRLSFYLNLQSGGFRYQTNLNNKLEIKVKKIRFDNQQIEELESKVIKTNSSENFRYSKSIVNVDSSNSGIYVLVIDMYDKNEKNIITKIYSNFTYIFSEQDLKNINFENLISITNKLNENIKK